MYRLFLGAIIFCLSLIAAASAQAAGIGDLAADFRQALEQGKASTLAEIDNDSLLLKRDDRFYTSGMGITRQYALRKDGDAVLFGWRIGQEQYTASDIKLPPELVVAPDHPYAGWLYAGMFKDTQRRDGSRLKVGVDLGCIGPCAGGEWVQRNLHRVINQPQPQGWSRQVRNEFGVVLHADMAPVRWTPRPYLDVTPNLHARFGNIFTDAGAGVTLRAGQFSAQPDMPVTFGFLRIDGRAVGYNATLQGGYFSHDNPHTVKPKRAVGELELGLHWSSAQYGARISLVRRSNEIDGLPNSIGAQNFVRLQLSYTP